MNGLTATQTVKCMLFDLDGTLVDTMPHHFRAYQIVFADLGVEIDFDTFVKVSGGPARTTIPRLLAGRSVAADIDDIHKRKLNVAAQLFEELKPVELALGKLLPILAQSYPLGLISSGSRRSVSATIETMGWQNLFGIVITGDEVQHGKPHPEGYLRAAEFFGAAPNQCLVFEDADDGITSAREAGMSVIDVRMMLPQWRLANGQIA
jgi:HAD superfamily hydrolase (TIGR01509 family)